MAEYLHVMEKCHQDDSVKREYYLEHQSYNNAYETNDEVRIEVRNKEKFTVPCESFLQIEGKIEKPSGIVGGDILMGQNFLMYLFDELRYEINGKQVDQIKYAGIATTIKGYCSFTPNDIPRLQPSGWKQVQNLQKRDVMDGSSFVAHYPLSMCMGFFERYRRTLINCTQTLIMNRSSTDSSAVMYIPKDSSDGKGDVTNIATIKQVKVKITKIKWVVKYFEPSVKTELGLMRILDSKKWLPLDFQHWDVAVYPLVPQTTHHTWSVRTYSNVEKPRYLLIAMGGDELVNSNFRHCSLRNVKAYLNANEYPYENQNADFDNDKYTTFYNWYVQFQTSYYGRKEPQPLLDYVNYKNHGPIIVIDCSKQNDTVKSSSVDLRIDFECGKQFPEKTSLYCVIIHDTQMEYNPFTGEVRKL